MKDKISTIFNIKNEPCGIKLFDARLRNAFQKIGINPAIFDLKSFSDNDSEIIFFHYVPSLYVDNTKIINDFLSKALAFKIVIIHGIYPKEEFKYCSDTICPELSQQLNIIKNNSDLIISLSNSTTTILKTWMPNISSKLLHTLYHPGLDSNSSILQTKKGVPYVFLGGITRPKKKINSTEQIQLIQSLIHSNIRVWLHSTPNIESESSISSVWKFTTNELSWGLWTEAIANASWVLCPYDTKIQTVSGLIAESISVGTRVLASSFPFSNEMSEKYKDHIVVNDNFKTWPEIILNNSSKIVPPKYPNWDTFLLELIKIIEN